MLLKSAVHHAHDITHNNSCLPLIGRFFVDNEFSFSIPLWSQNSRSENGNISQESARPLICAAISFDSILANEPVI